MQKGEVAKTIIRAIGAVGIFSALLIAPGLGQGVAILHKMTGVNKKSLKGSLYNLKKKNFITFKKIGGSYKMMLTDSGLKLLKKYSLENIQLVNKKKWDGWWRVITFDIPESKAGARRAVSRKLRELGCFPLQKSIFVYPHSCREEIDFIGNYFSSRQHICIINAKNIDGEDQIKKYFKL